MNGVSLQNTFMPQHLPSREYLSGRQQNIPPVPNILSTVWDVVYSLYLFDNGKWWSGPTDTHPQHTDTHTCFSKKLFCLRRQPLRNNVCWPYNFPEAWTYDFHQQVSLSCPLIHSAHSYHQSEAKYNFPQGPYGFTGDVFSSWVIFYQGVWGTLNRQST